MIINVLQGRKLKEFYYFTEKDNLYRRKVKEIYCSEKPDYVPRLEDRKIGI